MKSILAIIGTLSQDERQEFLLQLKRKTRRTDAKNQELFQLIAKGKTQNLDILLYGKPSKNAYHALCKRLHDGLIDFVASKSFATETSEELHLLKLLLASRIFFELKQFKIAFKTLVKAEKIAKSTDLYSILNEIYHTKIQYAHLNSKQNLGDVISDSEKNMRLFQQEIQLNRAYAVIKNEQKQKGIASKNTILTTFSRFSIEIDQMLTYKSLYQLMEITATTAKLQRDFHTISPYMMEIYQVISLKDMLSDKHRYYNIMILNLMASTCFRNKHFEDSVRFMKKMEVQMEKNNRKYFNRFSEKLIILKSLNSYYTGRPEVAFCLLSQYKGSSLDIPLLLAMCLFQKSDFLSAYEVLKRFAHSDDWYEKKMGWIWVLKKNMIEILALIELDKLDTVLLRTERFKRRFSKQLKQIVEKRVLIFLELVERYYENPKEVKKFKFRDSVENAFDWLGKEKEDIFVMSFYAWLKAKMGDDNLYEVTLKLVGQK